MIYVPVMLAEAETMQALFSEEYEAYRREVPLFVPRFTPYRASSHDGRNLTRSEERQFDLALYMRHREYRAVMGFVAAYALLAAKLVIL
jgi:hypothetical protein